MTDRISDHAGRRTPVQAAVARYRARVDDDRAARTDPQYNAQWKWLMRMLETADMAMEDEGIPRESRERVIRTILYGAPDPVEADRRIDERQRTVELLRTGRLGLAGMYGPDTPPDPPMNWGRI
jgi:hypothetical protein